MRHVWSMEYGALRRSMGGFLHVACMEYGVWSPAHTMLLVWSMECGALLAATALNRGALQSF